MVIGGVDARLTETFCNEAADFFGFDDTVRPSGVTAAEDTKAF